MPSVESPAEIYPMLNRRLKRWVTVSVVLIGTNVLTAIGLLVALVAWITANNTSEQNLLKVETRLNQEIREREAEKRDEKVANDKLQEAVKGLTTSLQKANSDLGAKEGELTKMRNELEDKVGRLQSAEKKMTELKAQNDALALDVQKLLSSNKGLAKVLDEKVVAAEENPYMKARVGDWAEYKMTINVDGVNREGLVKQIVTDRTEKEATITTTVTLGGQELPSQETKIDLTKPIDPRSTMDLWKGDEVKVEKISDGKEKIKVGGKEYACTWEKSKVKGKANDVDINAEIKVWNSKSVPLGGLVKMEMKSEVFNMTLELTETGSKKDK